MKLKNIFPIFSCFLAASLAAQEAPNILKIQPFYGGALSALSANGAWAVGDSENPSNSSMRAYPRLVNADTGEVKEIFSEAEGLFSAAISATCVSNDGRVAAGSYNNEPAVWKEGSGWSRLPMPDAKYNGGIVSAITPDGRFAVGRVSIDLFCEYPCMWDLQSGSLVELPGMIDFNPRYEDILEEGADPAEWSQSEVNVRLTGITPDANSILGMVDFAFPAASWEFLYSRDSASWIPLGMKYEDGRLSSLDGDIINVSECVFSADGSRIGGTYYSISDSSVPFTCLTSDPVNFSGHREGDGFGVWAIGSDGVVYGSTPVGTPIRNWSAKVGRYWYDWKMVLSQIYGIDWMADVTIDDLGLSGTVGSVSADNLRILATDWAENYSYIITLPRPMAEICKDVDLLADFRVSPPDGAEFSMLQTIVFDFGREVEVACGKTDVSLLDNEGNRVRASINVNVQPDNKNHVEVIFRNFTMEPGKDYTVVVPQGGIRLAGDAERANKEIRISYRGREEGPVRPVAISPADGARVPRINFTTNPVTITFNATITAGETPDIRLYQVKEGMEEFLFPLNASISNRQMLVYPVAEQRLADATEYRITVGEGTVTDLSGTGGNEPFTITYQGSYVPEIDPSSNTIFFENFSLGVGSMMLMEGDGNQPSEEMAAWGFTADSTPWVPVLDNADNLGNYAAASHSSYTPAGKSDDWMVTPQLFIPDDKATLTFKSQSYRAGKNDMLKVFVWASEDILTVLTPAVADKMRYDGDLVYYKLQSPGDTEDVMAGEWTENTVDLSAYAGKYIYIAFLNDNQNQSAVFIDDVLVSREVVAILSVDTEPTVVNADKVGIYGRFVAMRETGLDGYSITLTDAEGRLLSQINSTDRVEPTEICEFDFPDDVTIDKGVSTDFFIAFASGTDKIDVKFTLRNLLFETTKRIVLEEMTGTTCQFCPQGIIAVDYLSEIYGDRFIPIAIHSYTGDSFGGAEMAAYSQFLGLNAAPTGSICRGASTSPMYFNQSDYVFSAPDGKTWLQAAEEALRTLSDADINVSAISLDEASGNVNVDMKVKFAVSRTNANINVFGVLMEDDLFGIQSNGLSYAEYPGLGEWGKGGAYGKSMVIWDYDDVVRGTSAVATGGIYSGFNGKGGYLPPSVAAGEEYDVKFEFRIPSGVSDAAKTKVCVMLIDANTGEYINAAVARADGAAVDVMDTDTETQADVFDLSGRMVLRGARLSDLQRLERGIYIRAGKKFIIH